jgi:hypothetical protein
MYDERNNPYEISELTTNKLTEKVENKSSVKTDRELMEETLVKIEKRVNQVEILQGCKQYKRFR